MAFLNSFIGAFYDISVSAPTGDLWATLILDVFNFITNYGWRVVLFTFILKLLLSPADIFQKISSRKQQKVQAKLAPEFEKIDRQFANDTRTAMQKKQALQKEMGAGMNPLVSCLPMILTLVVFITLFNSLQNIGAYKNLKQYVDLFNEYNNVTQCVLEDTSKGDDVYGVYLAKDGNPDQDRIDDYKTYYVKGLDEYVDSLSTETNASIIDAYNAAGVDTYAEAKAFVVDYVIDPVNDPSKSQFQSFSSFVGQRAVHKLYGNTMEGFMWIKNIWAVDAMWTAPVNDYTTFTSNIRYTQNGGTSCNCSCNCSPSVTNNISFNTELTDIWESNGVLETSKKTEKERILKKDTYETVMGELRKDSYYNSANGYLILPLLSIVLALVNQIITHIQQKRNGQDMGGQQGMTMKLMMWTMPVMIGMFAFMNVAAFALYLVVSYLVSLIVSLIMMLIYHIMDKKMDDDNIIHTYGRPNFNK
ncbi:MAG: membrane protein insertase YidC [Clostridia bacterium]|nr:membrane protein insertase YidC [Clostridia bacterium]